MPLVAHCHLESVTPYSQSKTPDEPKKAKEGHDDYEKRIWPYKSHVNAEGRVTIPPMAFKFALSSAARMLGERIPGKGTATWSKHFEAGVQVLDPLVLPLDRKALAGEWIFAHANGKRGSGKRVKRCFPVIPHWSGVVTYYILDAAITREVFERTLKESGNFIGIGRFRLENGGQYGRFKVVKIDWVESQAA